MGSFPWPLAHAFEYFGGTGRLLVPDNLRAGVSKADRYEPVLNPAYARLAEHYGSSRLDSSASSVVAGRLATAFRLPGECAIALLSMFAVSRSEPPAIAKARKLVVWWRRWWIPAHRFRFELTALPDQYRVTYARWDKYRGAVEWSLVPRLTLSPDEFYEWQAWLDGGKR